MELHIPRCNQCQKKYGGLLCHACFVESPHASHKYTQVKVTSGVKPCHCGIMKSFKRKPTCNKHLAQKGILKSTRNIEINGYIIPVSPDGIPMVQLARKAKIGEDTLEMIADGIAERKKSRVTFLKHSLYGHPGYPPIPGSRRAEGLDPLEMAVEEIISSQERLSTVDRIPPWQAANYFTSQQKSSQESYENDMLYGFKRKENQPNKGLNFIDVVNQISEKTKTADRKRSSAYARVEQFNNAFFLDFKFKQRGPKRSTLESVCPRMARNSRSCSVVVTNSSTDSSLISSTNTSNSYSSNSTYNNRQASHLWTNYSNPLFDARPWHPMLESIR
ncbi:unnamed protein product [Oikopleura dioica]|uniref:UBR-type domain-containing protein n=1 Tax=Oikopleura dioica TaxID=34765 RepID=E4XSM8_OIKDI|nr:unnamed protein product [Oikopleura dioica]